METNEILKTSKTFVSVYAPASNISPGNKHVYKQDTTEWKIVLQAQKDTSRNAS